MTRMMRLVRLVIFCRWYLSVVAVVQGFFVTTTTPHLAVRRRHKNPSSSRGDNRADEATITSRYHRGTLSRSSSLWPPSLLGWSKQAVMNVRTQTPMTFSTTTLPPQQHETAPHRPHPNEYVDLSVPSAWLRHYPDGVYTVVRADLSWLQPNDNDDQVVTSCPPHVWGLDFHLQRLQQSYTTLYSSESATTNAAHEAAALDAARRDSMAIVDCLLAETLAHWEESTTTTSGCIVCMVTLLWYPTSTTPNNARDDDDNKNGAASTIHVRGHVCTTPPQPQPQETSPPLQVALALDTATSLVDKNTDNEEPPAVLLPNRKDHHPECKQSAWCTNRQVLETTFKTKGVNEVFLTMMDPQSPPQGGDGNHPYYILEGLTSNCFFVVRDANNQKVLKTPDQHILQGYARHRVLQAAQALGYRVTLGPVSLDEAADWEEVFCTSAIRLVQPVQSIVLAVGNKAQPAEEDEKVEEQDAKDEEPRHHRVVWQSDASSNYAVATSILKEILKQEERFTMGQTHD